MNFAIVFVGFTGLFLPLLILFFNKGYRSANRFLSGFLFISSLYLLQNFFIFYSQSDFWVAFSISTQVDFYLIGPFSFFYLRSILIDDTHLKKSDYLHFFLFVISCLGLIPFWFTSWDYKLEIANNMQSDAWDLAQFKINLFVPHIIDQVLHVAHMLFYAICLWTLLIRYYKKNNESFKKSNQFNLIRKWLIVFCTIFSIISIDYLMVMANVWIFDNKTDFLNESNSFLLFASILYVSVNMAVLSFPQIMYGLPIEKSKVVLVNNIPSDLAKVAVEPLFQELEASNDEKNIEFKIPPQLFSKNYIKEIEESLDLIVNKKLFLDPDFKLVNIFNESNIPLHHLTYYFNNVRMITFSEWRNKLRVEYSISIFEKKESLNNTIESISLQSGFTSQATFIRSFKNITGTTPSEFLKKFHHLN